MTERAVEASAIPAQLPNVSVAVLGAGKMGGILLQAFLKTSLWKPHLMLALKILSKMMIILLRY